MTSNSAWNAEYNNSKGSLLVGNGTRPVVRTVGTDGQVLTANSAQADGVEWQTPGAGALVNLSPYIVGPTQSDFTTISAAIAQAVLDGASAANPYNIYIKPGTYVENVSVSDGINLIGFGARRSYTSGIAVITETGTVIISGKVTVTGSFNSLCNINIVPPAGDAFDINQTAGGNLTLDKCNIYTTSGAALNFIGSGIAGEFLSLNDCSIFVIGIGSRVLNCVNLNNNVNISFTGCSIETANATYSLVSNGSVMNLLYESCFIRDEFDFTGSTGGGINLRNSYLSMIGAFGIITDTSIFAFNARNSFIGTSVGFLSGSNATSSIVAESCSFSNSPTYTLPAGASVFIHSFNGNGLYMRGGSGYNNSQYESTTARTQTTNATPTALFSLPVSTNTSVTLKAQITAADSTHANAVGGDLLIVVNRAGGAAAIVGVVTTNVQSTSAATFTATVSANNIVINVTGVAATTYNWTCYVEYQRMLTDS